MNNIYIGVGSNIDPETNILKAVNLLKKKVVITACSNFYKTKPILNNDQNDYLNGVWQIKSDHKPEFIKFKILKSIEKKLKRKKTVDKYSSRTIDLDLLLYDGLVIKNDKIKLPDPDIYNRIFIALPLMEINKNLILPDTKLSIKTVVDNIKDKNIICDLEITKKIKMFLTKEQ